MVFRPKDPYHNRPLPYLIGSKEWHEKWHIGLIDSDLEDDDMSGNGGNEEMSDSSSTVGSLHSHVPASTSESEHSVWGVASAVAAAAVTVNNNEHVNGNNNQFSLSFFQIFFYNKILFIAEEQDIMENSNDTTGNSSNLKDVMSTVPKHIIPEQSNSIFLPQRQEIPHFIANLFDSEPPELDDVPTDSQKDRKPVNLFLDDEDDDDSDFNIIAGNKSDAIAKETFKPIGETSKLPKSKPFNLFENNDSDNDDEALFNATPKEPIKSKPQIPNLFGDEDDNELDIEPQDTATAAQSIKTSLPKKGDLFQSLFDDEPPEDDFDIFVKAEPKPSQSSKNILQSGPEVKIKSQEVISTKLAPKINLFDDDDDDDGFENLIKSNPKTDELKEAKRESIKPEEIIVEAKSKTAFADIFEKEPALTNTSPYAFAQLFDNLPPDDDELHLHRSSDTQQHSKTLSTENIKKSSEFYNDFSETVTVTSSSNEINKTPHYSYLFNDEPPPDDNGDLFASTITSITKPNKIIQKDSNFSKKLNMFTGADKTVTESDSSEKPTTIRKPKKLDLGKLDINVAALLPGAKRVITKPKNEVENDSAAENSNLEIKNEISVLEKVFTSTIKTVSTDNVDSAGRLNNLNRNRVKIQTRRPSTRRGRQKQYEKSLETENDGDNSIAGLDENDAIDHKKTIVSEQNNNIRSTPPKIMEDGKTVDVNKEMDATNNSKLLEKVSTSVSLSDDDVSHTKSITKHEIVPNENAANILSFLDINENEEDTDDWLVNAMADTKVTETNTTKSKTVLFDDEPEFQSNDSNAVSPKLSKSVSKSISNKISTESTIFQPTQPPPLPASMTNSSLFDDESAEDDWSPFPISDLKNKSEQTNIPKQNLLSDQPPPLFLSNDTALFDDADDSYNANIFGSVSAASEKAKPASSLDPPKVTSLFDEHSDDDDDLFGKRPSLISEKKEKSNNLKIPQTQASKSLFGDDSSDDDLFGGDNSSTKVIKKRTLKNSSDAAAKAVFNKKPTSGKLFSDSEDEDLFAAKPKTSTVKASKKSSTQSRIIKSTASALTDTDPLADLLK